MHTCAWRVSDCKNVSSCWETAKEGPVDGVSCGSRELLPWAENKYDRRASK
jgi:hypothetical protein